MDDINLIGTPKELEETADYLKKIFEMKDLGKTRFCLWLQIERNSNGMLVHQSKYTKKVLKRFGTDKAHPLSTPMVDRPLDIKKNPYRPIKENERYWVPKYHIEVLLEPWCTWHNALNWILHFLLTYVLDIALHQLKGTWLVLSTSYDICMEQLI